MSNLSGLNLQSSLEISKSLLTDFINQPSAKAELHTVFGNSNNTQKSFDEIASLVDNDFNNLNIEIRSSSEINHAQGAFLGGNNTIYLSQEFVSENANNPNAIAKVILEEIGHYVDWKANIEDAPGDEGAIFASLVLDRELSSEELATLQAEDDSAVIELDGETATIEQAKVIYVRQGATGENDGTSWANAYTDLQDAIAAAQANDEVWVAAGNYKPTTDGDREISFNITEFAQFYGGFAGNETERSQRDIEVNQTILSGNIGAENDRTDNSYHVVNITGTAATTVLDGFTITGGYANDGGSRINEEDVGGGIYSDESGNARLSNLRVINNFAFGDGGGIYLDASSNPVLTNVDIVNNEAQQFGGGIRLRDNSSPILNSVTIANNLAGDDGGGVSNNGGIPVFNRVVFNGNVANDAGGALINVDNDGVRITNSLFRNNQSQRGGAIFNRDSDLTINNSTFFGNLSDFAGAIYSFDEGESSRLPSNTESVINNSILSNNFGALDNLQIVDDGTSSSNISVTTVNNSIVEGGYEGAGGNNLDTSPRFINPGEGNFRLRSNSPAIDRGNESVIDAEFDLAGDERVVNGAIDLGAYEFQDNLPAGTVYRFVDPEADVYFYTTDKNERDSIINDLPRYQYEGGSYKAFTEEEADELTGLKPVYRFFNNSTGVHIYTIDENERNVIQETLPNYVSEGVAYYAYENQLADSVPVYRFYNTEADAHFYTPSAQERDETLETFPNYQLEGDSGVSFYVDEVSN